MRRLAEFTFCVACVVWLTWQERPAAWAVQCQSGGALVQQNFHPVLDGWYCSPFDDNSQLACSGQAQAADCEAACQECGQIFTSSNYCSWNRSAEPHPHTDAITLGGCTTPGWYAHKFTTSCNCTLPSCKPNGVLCSYSEECCSGYCGVETGWCGGASPIMINLAGNSRNFHLTSAIDGVSFDINAGGKSDQVSWTEPDSSVALLALDRNGNGFIDNGSELFGDATLMSNNRIANNGFEALSDFDVNADGRIDANDAVFHSLRLWLDRDHDGISDGDELLSLDDGGVTAIFTQYRESRRVDRNGNRYAYVGSALIVRRDREHRRAVFDVYLNVSQ